MHSMGGAGEAVVRDQQGFVRTLAEVNVETRLAFLRRTYMWLGLALGIAAAIAALSFSFFIENFGALQTVLSPVVWMGILAGSMILSGFVFGRLLLQPRTATWGLFGQAAVEGLIFGPLLAVAYIVSVGVNDPGYTIIIQGVVLTTFVFGGITAYVFLTKQDFSFMKGALVVLGSLLMGVVLVSLVSAAFGATFVGEFWFGIAICSLGILFGAGSMLYTTSRLVLHGIEGQEKMFAAALLSEIAIVLWYVIYLLIILASRR